ncbi:DUF6328 family protein [Phycicoccus sp. HDW14]|uniref:DUF6328 family protein n=1 Tax=Phycicoccus sp. HDW14 TaxID=2714941 RepID=UPI00197C694A|nr:DUF6328 family protein [Phycicoccus sp. HDW14]
MAGPDGRRPSRRTLSRNWDELMQELRVIQTGVQILTGFLLTVPFSNRFPDLTDAQRGVYLAVLGGAVLTTGFVVAPVAYHRVLFRERQRELLVESANRLAQAGLTTLLLTVAGVVFLVVDLVLGRQEAYVAGGLALVLLLGLWFLAPVGLRASGLFPRNLPPDSPRDAGDDEDADRDGARGEGSA